MITLYVDGFWISPYAFSAFVALEEKGLPYETRTLALDKDENHTAEYVKASLTGKVPALHDGDYWLSESMAIDEYLAETYPFPKYPRIFPEDLKDRGHCRQLMSWIRTDLLSLREERGSHSMFYERATKPLSKAGEAAAAELVRIADLVIPSGRTTLFSQWCIADADLTFILQRLNLNGHPLPPRVKAYCEANWQRPSVQKWVQRKRLPYVPY